MMLEGLLIFFVVILLITNGFWFLLQRETLKTVDKFAEKEKDITVKAFPENPEAYAHDPDFVPMDEISDKELKEAIDKIQE